MQIDGVSRSSRLRTAPVSADLRPPGHLRPVDQWHPAGGRVTGRAFRLSRIAKRAVRRQTLARRPRRAPPACFPRCLLVVAIGRPTPELVDVRLSGRKQERAAARFGARRRATATETRAIARSIAASGSPSGWRIRAPAGRARGRATSRALKLHPTMSRSTRTSGQRRVRWSRRRRGLSGRRLIAGCGRTSGRRPHAPGKAFTIPGRAIRFSQPLAGPASSPWTAGGRREPDSETASAD